MSWKIKNPVFMALKAAKDIMRSPHVENVIKRRYYIALNCKTYTSEMMDTMPDPLKLQSLFYPTHNGVTVFYPISTMPTLR